ncbi:MAG: putative metal-binding motif-containing protein, partial [Myxococcota bacterium]|nr:putative metal-binding motif-containing protein [Myxococcota bacterium]
MKFLFSISVLIFLPACSADKTALENIETDVNTDVDADGFHIGEDCDDTNETINPAATEMCDGVDNNCDGVVDENVTIVIYEDSDGDGYGNAASQMDACEVLPGYASNGTDCNDEESKAFPGNLEVCDGVDNDCNGAMDDEDLNLDLNSAFIYYIDLDGDGYGNSETG